MNYSDSNIYVKYITFHIFYTEVFDDTRIIMDRVYETDVRRISKLMMSRGLMSERYARRFFDAFSRLLTWELETV